MGETMLSNILVFGSDDVLLNTRRMILEKAGFEALTTSQISDAERIMKEHNVALLVVCSSVENKDVSQVLQAASTVRPNIKTLVVNHGAPIDARSKTESIDGFRGPSAFLTAVDRALGFVRG
jgi:DNA-binding NtrC family response regulator